MKNSLSRFIPALGLVILFTLTTFVSLSSAEEPDFGGSGQPGRTTSGGGSK